MLNKLNKKVNKTTMKRKVTSKKSKKGTKKGTKKSTKMNTKRMQRGGKIVLPSEYFGNSSGRYHAVGSSALKSCSKQFPVSHGVSHENGMWAGPVLFPQHAGGNNKKGKKTNKMNKRKPSKMNKKGKKTNKRNYSYSYHVKVNN